jgi:lysophospholipid acyltransferase (LPLAT)-like uncharacterized protein
LEGLKIHLTSSLGYWIIRIIGSTLRWYTENWHILKSIRDGGKKVILAFWHGRIFMATYRFRGQGIVVMISRNRDGEYISRIIRRFGYGVARGSSSRGSHGATVEILRAMEKGQDVGLSIDGPRGPRYVAKPGAAFLAKKSGNPVLPFSISVEKKWMIKSWDHFQVPKPFSRAVVLIGNPVYVNGNASEEEIEMAEAKIQHLLEELRDRGDSWWGGEPDQ